MCWDEVEILIRRAQRGDRVAFGDLVARFQGAVYGFALTKVRDAHMAQELTQEVFVHAMRKIVQLRDPRCFAGWLRRITARMAVNKLTRRGITAGAPEALDGVAAVAVDPLDAAVRSEERTTVRAALKRLKAIDRSALEAFYLKGQSLNEIADRFDVPLGTVKRRLHTARNRLKAALEGRGATQRPRRELVRM